MNATTKEMNMKQARILNKDCSITVLDREYKLGETVLIYCASGCSRLDNEEAEIARLCQKSALVRPLNEHGSHISDQYASRSRMVYDDPCFYVPYHNIYAKSAV